MNNESYNEIDFLILNGALEVIGLDDNGEFLYAFTDKIMEMLPDLKEEVSKTYVEEIDTLWELGYLNMDISKENPSVTLTNMAYNDKMVSELPPRLQTVLLTVKYFLSSQ
jgi:hypothetical protein